MADHEYSHHSEYRDLQTRQRGDPFSERFSNPGGPGANSVHPAALQSGSAIYLPPSTQLREDNVSRLLHQTADSNEHAYYGPADDNPFKDDTATITPFDSISNVGERDDLAQQPATVYGGPDYLHRDPYASRQQTATYPKSYNTRPRSGSAGSSGEVYDARASNDGSLPLMQHAVLPAATHGGAHGDARPSSRSGRSSYYADSFVDGDTIIDKQTGRKSKLRSAPTLDSYPPFPRYDGPDVEEKGDFQDASRRSSTRNGSKDDLVSTLKGNNKSGKRPNVFLRQIRDNTPLDEKIRNHQAGIGVQDRPWACWLIAIVLVVVFIVELVRSAQKTGKAISTSPFNYMIGPSSEMLINLGARFTACMRSIPEITNTPFRCLDDTSSSSTITKTCTLEEICGFGGFGSSTSIPNQTFRFFTALWLHVGVVHLLLNGLVLLTSSALVEKQIGTLKFLILYNISGVFGFILGGNFSLTGLASMGASGAIFGTHAAVLVDLIWHWRLFERPKRMLFALIFEIIVGFGLGYIPGIDNFSHIGGFAIGLLLSIVLVPAIHQNSKHRVAIYIARTLAFVGACVMFGVLLNNFFQSDPNSACQWCRYLSCWPTAANNHCEGTGLTMSESTTPTSITSTDMNGTIGASTNSNIALAIVSILSIFVTRSQYKR